MPEGGAWKDLFKATREGDSATANHHLRLGVDPDFQHPEYFTSPLFEAIRHGNLEIVKLLIEKGNANPELIEELTDDTVVDACLAHKQFDILEYLNTKLPHKKRFHFRHVLITSVRGGGGGTEMCKELLLKGHKVVFLCDCKDTAASIKNELLSLVSSNDVSNRIGYIVGSLDSTQNIQMINKQVRERFCSINTLVCNTFVWSTQLTLNEEGLERSFVMNSLSKYLLSRELLSVLGQNENPRIVFVTPEVLISDKTMDWNKTPYGKDFDWYRSFSKTVNYCNLFFATLILRTNKSNVTITMVKTKVACTLLNTSNGCLACIHRLVNQIINTDTAAKAPLWLTLTEASHEDIHGKIFVSNNKNKSTVSQDYTQLLSHNESLPTQYQEWLSNFLSGYTLD